jgi:DNA-binding CsgD family transcriptional regulator
MRLDHELAPRATDVVDLVIRGYTNRQIATALDMTEDTVKQHLYHVYAMYGINAKTHMARICLAMQVTYERHPELMPFFDGDRASQYGYPSAMDNLRTAAETDAFNCSDTLVTSQKKSRANRGLGRK